MDKAKSNGTFNGWQSCKNVHNFLKIGTANYSWVVLVRNFLRKPLNVLLYLIHRSFLAMCVLVVSSQMIGRWKCPTTKSTLEEANFQVTDLPYIKLWLLNQVKIPEIFSASKINLRNLRTKIESLTLSGYFLWIWWEILWKIAFMVS